MTLKNTVDSVRTTGSTATDTSASRHDSRYRAVKLTAKSSVIRPNPMAWSAKNFRTASMSEVALSMRSPVEVLSR